MLRPKAFLRKLSGKSSRELLRTAPRFARDQLQRRAVDAYYWWTLHAWPAARTRRRRAATARLEAADELLFLCHGNICRSPFAERYARRRLDARDINSLAVDSAGAVEMNDPRSPAEARGVAADYGVDLADHRSVKATAAAIDAADLILLMDYRDYHTYTTRYPEAVDRMFLLRIFEKDGAMQIHDPHGYDESVFQSVYRNVASNVKTMLDEYERAADARNDPSVLSDVYAELRCRALSALAKRT